MDTAMTEADSSSSLPMPSAASAPVSTPPPPTDSLQALNLTLAQPEASLMGTADPDDMKSPGATPGSPEADGHPRSLASDQPTSTPVPTADGTADSLTTSSLTAECSAGNERPLPPSSVSNAHAELVAEGMASSESLASSQAMQNEYISPVPEASGQQSLQTPAAAEAADAAAGTAGLAASAAATAASAAAPALLDAAETHADPVPYKSSAAAEAAAADIANEPAGAPGVADTEPAGTAETGQLKASPGMGVVPALQAAVQVQASS